MTLAGRKCAMFDSDAGWSWAMLSTWVDLCYNVAVRLASPVCERIEIVHLTG